MKEKNVKGRPALAAAATPWNIAQRTFLALLAGYFLAAETMGLLGRLLGFAMARAEAAGLTAMLAFVVYLIVIVWVFADRNLTRLWLAIPGGALLCYSISTILAAGGTS